MRILASLWKEEEGQDLIEYVLLVAVVGLAVAATFPTTLVPAITGVASKAATCLGGGAC
jgi:Flp pilus assembly pilin Flp